MKSLALVRLLQLTSQALPVGGYSHSHGLESAVEQRIVADEESAANWISDMLDFSMKTFEIPRLLNLGRAWTAGDFAAVRLLNDESLASRESAELRAASVQMGYSLRVLLSVLPDFPADIVDALRTMAEPALPCVWSAAATAWRIEPRDSILGYLWSWAENQVLVAMKTVPLGQSAGQRILQNLGTRMARFAESSDLSAEPRSNFAPGLAILSSQHEIQYSRLFRS
jgi:urease accessory protein